MENISHVAEKVEAAVKSTSRPTTSGPPPKQTPPDSSGKWASRSRVEPPPGIPACETCGNTGVVKYDVPVGHPAFGKVFPCPECGPARRQQLYDRRMERVSRYSVSMTEGRTFDTWETRDTTATLALRRARAFVDNPEGWLLLWGETGCGKTHLAMAIAQALREKPILERPIVLLATVPRLLDMLRSGYDRGDYDEIAEMVRNVEVLMLDDLGTEHLTPWAQERLFDVINHRYNAQLPLVVTTNVNPGDLAPRIASRIQDRYLCKQIHITSGDYRIERRGT